jgi:hypothetical protein
MHCAGKIIEDQIIVQEMKMRGAGSNLVGHGKAKIRKPSNWFLHSNQGKNKDQQHPLHSSV